jgi:hypothetical protein
MRVEAVLDIAHCSLAGSNKVEKQFKYPLTAGFIHCGMSVM